MKNEVKIKKGVKMKKSLLLLIVMGIIMLFSVSCGSDDSDDNSSTGFNLTSPEYLSSLDYYLEIDSSLEDGSDPAILIFSKNEVVDYAFSINDTNIELEWTNFSFLAYFSWEAIVTLNNVPENISLNPGDVLDISFSVGRENFETSLEIPYKPIVNYPDFSCDQDFAYSWTVEQNADLQSTWFTFESYDAMMGENGYVDETWDLSPSDRSYTVSKNLYSAYAADPMKYICAGVDVINYKEFTKCTFVTATYSDEYSSDIWGLKNAPEGNDRHIKLFESIR